MQGIEARADEGVLDESPAAYKDIGAVMEAQQDLVSIRHRLQAGGQHQGVKGRPAAAAAPRHGEALSPPACGEG